MERQRLAVHISRGNITLLCELRRSGYLTIGINMESIISCLAIIGGGAILVLCILGWAMLGIILKVVIKKESVTIKYNEGWNDK